TRSGCGPRTPAARSTPCARATGPSTWTTSKSPSADGRARRRSVTPLIQGRLVGRTVRQRRARRAVRPRARLDRAAPGAGGRRQARLSGECAFCCRPTEGAWATTARPEDRQADAGCLPGPPGGAQAGERGRRADGAGVPDHALGARHGRGAGVIVAT